MALPVALQVYSVRDYAEKDLYGTLRKIKQMGYDGVEFAGLYNNDPAQIRTWLDELGLKAVSAHVPMDDFRKDLAGTIAAYHAIGCDYVAIPWMPQECLPGGEKYAETREEIVKIGTACRDAGMPLLYHNHDFEFRVVDGIYALDYLYKDILEDILKTELDTCWVNVGGEDPAPFVRKYTGRAPVVHLKDFVGDKTSGDKFELIGQTRPKIDKKNDSFSFMPVGSGLQDMPSILAAAVDAGAAWVVVEQDEPAAGCDSIASAVESISYLKNLNW